MELQKNELFDLFVVYLTQAYAEVAKNAELAKKAIEETGTTEIKVPLPTVISIGSTRSGKTFVKAQIIFIQLLQSEAKGKPLIVKCYRNLLTDCATKTYVDFVKAARSMGIEDKLRFTGGNRPMIRYGKSEISFLGVSEESEVQQAACDIAFFNEAFEISNRRFVRQVVTRCTKLVIYDGNPTDSGHWLYSEMKGDGVKVFHSTYRDNKFLTPTERFSIEQYCPWVLEGYYIKKDGRWQWTIPEEERLPNEDNIARGTANRYDWLVKGEGIPSEKEGCVFNVNWVAGGKLPPLSEFEDIGFGLDFGWSNDQTAFVMSGNIGSKLYSIKLIYEPLLGKSAEDKLEYLHQQIASIMMRPYTDYFQREVIETEDGTVELVEEQPDMLWVALAKSFCPVMTSEGEVNIAEYSVYVSCETQDNFKDVRFVTGLKNLAYRDKLDFLKYYKIKKPRKYKGVANLQAWKLYVVQCTDTQREFNNFTYRMIGDEVTTILEDNKKVANNFDHYIDAWIYVAHDRFRKV